MPHSIVRFMLSFHCGSLIVCHIRHASLWYHVKVYILGVHVVVMVFISQHCIKVGYGIHVMHNSIDTMFKYNISYVLSVSYFMHHGMCHIPYGPCMHQVSHNRVSVLIIFIINFSCSGLLINVHV